ncbi:MAG: hypothetical protein HZC12_03160 [Nitrospirae bacterium]|nr:hypothetical protein [Nitrospirota bacterium]
MKKLSILTAVLFVLALAVPAMATVDVYVDIDKEKTITVNENVNINKNIKVDVSVVTSDSKAAEASAHVNATNIFDFACENCAEKVSTIEGSILGNRGIVNVNQATGNMNNQGNVISIAIDVPPDNGGNTNGGTDGFANAQAAVDQMNHIAAIHTINVPIRDAIIVGSINSNRGIVGVNQSVGNINNQHNAIAIAIAMDGAVALNEADLGQANIIASVSETNTHKRDIISGSINENRGIVNVNQTSGNMNNQANVVSMSLGLNLNGGSPSLTSLP